MVNLLLLANLIPLSAGFHASDGKNILRLVFDPKGTAKRLFITEYLQTIPLIRDSLATENWLEAQSLATALLKKAPDDHSCKELQEALHHAVAIAQQRLDAETKPDPED